MFFTVQVNVVTRVRPRVSGRGTGAQPAQEMFWLGYVEVLKDLEQHQLRFQIYFGSSPATTGLESPHAHGLQRKINHASISRARRPQAKSVKG